MAKKLTSLAPAAGWWAAYSGDGDPYFHRVIAFVIVEEDDLSFVDAVDTLDICEGNVCSDADNFLGLFHETEFQIIGEVLNPYGHDRLHAKGR